jgi:hypothetical protein
VKEKQRVAIPPPPRAWTRADDYIGAMVRKRSFRRARAERQRTQPERPTLLLSTVPFLALSGLLAILAVAIMVAAFPGAQPQHKASQAVAREQGVAQRGWFQEAQKEMH